MELFGSELGKLGSFCTFHCITVSAMTSVYYRLFFIFYFYFHLFSFVCSISSLFV
jgi:hypothetical protein